MKYTKILLGLLAMAAAVGFTGCSDSEDILEPSNEKFDNPFAVPDGMTGPEAEIRRDFFKNTGIYLIFNDTLRTYTDRFGVERTELVDFDYTFTGSPTHPNRRFEYIENTEEMKIVADLIAENLAPRIKDGQFRPFSIIPLKDMATQNYSGAKWEDKKTFTNFRCLAVNVDPILDAETPEDAVNAVNDVIIDLINSKISVWDASMDEFFESVDELSSEYISDYIDDWDRDITQVNELGFLRFYESWSISYDYFPNRKNDFADYLDLVIKKTSAEVEELYGEYPVIMNRYEFLANYIRKMGVKI